MKQVLVGEKMYREQENTLTIHQQKGMRKHILRIHTFPLFVIKQILVWPNTLQLSSNGICKMENQKIMPTWHDMDESHMHTTGEETC